VVTDAARGRSDAEVTAVRQYRAQVASGFGRFEAVELCWTWV
jgi:hypothetical protein